MTGICKRLRLPKGAAARTRRVLLRALALTVPTLIINLIMQGRREFRPELETRKKYRQLIHATIRKDD